MLCDKALGPALAPFLSEQTGGKVSPNPVIPTLLVTTTATSPGNLSHYDVDQSLRHDNDLDDLLALNQGFDLFVIKRCRTQLGFRNRG